MLVIPSATYEWNIVNNQENCDEVQVAFYKETKLFAYKMQTDRVGKAKLIPTPKYQRWLESKVYDAIYDINKKD